MELRKGEKMKSIVPYTKEIVFDSKIAEICSISLEHEISCNDSGIEGNFIVSGEFRSHEVSINKEPFQYKLPFSVEVTDKILEDSVDFEITDFTYEILKDNILKVNIEFMVSAEEVVEEEPVIDEPEEVEEIPESRQEEEVKEAVMEEINQMFLEENSDDEEEKIEPEEENEDRLDAESEDLILTSASSTDDEFATYHIHIVSSEDTIESIVAMYQTDVNTLKSYNNVESLSAGDKIIIPCLDE